MTTILMIVAGSILTQTAPGGDLSVIVTGASDAKFPEIAVEFEIRRPDGSFLLDAKQGDIRVTEEGRPMSILRFQTPTEAKPMPTTVVLVVDRSSSMMIEDRIGNLKEAVAMFMTRLPKESRVAVVAFGSEVRTVCSFTNDARAVKTAVNALYPAGSTRFYDAVDSALRMLESESGRRAVLALTDGADTSSDLATLDSVIVSARRLGLPVHTLGLGGESGTSLVCPALVLVVLGVLAARIRRRLSNAKANFASCAATGCMCWVALLIVALIVLYLLAPSPAAALRRMAEETRGQYYRRGKLTSSTRSTTNSPNGSGQATA